MLQGQCPVAYVRLASVCPMRTLFAVMLVFCLGGCVNSNKPPPDGVLDPRGEK